MKKIFLLLTIMTSFFFALSIDSNALSIYGTPGYDYFDNLTLDIDIDELNGFSLREVFENGNLFNYNIQAGSIEELKYEYRLFDTTTFTLIKPNITLNTNALHYISFDTYISDPISNLMIVTNGGTYNSFSYNLNDWTKIQFRWVNTNNEVLGPYYYDTGTLNNQFYLLKNALLLDLEYYEIENLSNGQIDYFYSLYQLLRAGIDPQSIYDIGYIHGFNAGNDFGYDNGYDDGLSDGYNNGYSDGQEDGYETGYVDGNVAGLETGYLNGYNDGFDEGVVTEVDTQWLLGFVTGTINVLGVSIIPGISLGVFVFIPLFLGFIGFIFRLGGRRG